MHIQVFVNGRGIFFVAIKVSLKMCLDWTLTRFFFFLQKNNNKHQRQPILQLYTFQCNFLQT